MNNEQKVFINGRFRGSIELADSRYAQQIFKRICSAYARRQGMGIHLLFSKKRLQGFEQGETRGIEYALKELQMYLDLGALLHFDTRDAKELKSRLELLGDMAQFGFDLHSRVKLANSDSARYSKADYLFWDIENFSEVAPVFNDLIEPLEIPDDHIYIAANPDSLYVKGRQWEIDFYDYGKRLESFNFTKCDHGKNVADDLLLEAFERLDADEVRIFLLSFDRELKERFLMRAKESVDLYLLQ